MEAQARLVQCLQATLDADAQRRKQAESYLKEWEQNKPAEFVCVLAQTLQCREALQAPVRQSAGILLKNNLGSNDPTKDEQLKTRWLSFNNEAKKIVQNCLLDALVDPSSLDVRKAAATAIANLAAIEVPNDQWPELIQTLSKNGSEDVIKASASFVAFGFISEKFVDLTNPQVVIPAAIINSILTAVVSGMQRQEGMIKLAATQAFYYGILLASENFKKEDERNQIVQTIVINCNCYDNPDVQMAAFECLVQIAQFYYEHLEPYLEGFAELTFQAIKTLPEKIALPAMEFWSTICDEEQYLIDEIRELGQSSQKYLRIIEIAQKPLIDMLLAQMPKHDCTADDDDRSWNLAMAAATCLHLSSQVIGNQLVLQVMDFVGKAMITDDWKIREAGVLAYGSIIEGSSTDTMGPYIQQSSQKLLETLHGDPVVAVRDTAAWTIGQICRHHYGIIPLKDLVPILIHRLGNDTPRVVSNCCFVIHVLAEKQGEPHDPPLVSDLSPYFTNLADALLTTANKHQELRVPAFNAFGVLVSRAGQDQQGSFMEVLHVLLNALQASFVLADNQEKKCELQSLLCGCLQQLTQRMGEAVVPNAERLFNMYYQVFHDYVTLKGQECLQDETLQAVGALIRAIGDRFDAFMNQFLPLLLVGLKNHEDTAVCRCSMWVVGDLCRNLQKKIIPYVEPILTTLYPHLENKDVNRDLRALILLCFGDIAMVIGADFERYFQPVMEKLSMAANIKVDDIPEGRKNDEWIRYLNSLRNNVLEAYTGIIHGFKECGRLKLFQSHVFAVLDFIERIVNDWRDKLTTDLVMKNSCGLIGDLILVYHQQLVQECDLKNKQYLQTLLEFCQRSNDNAVKSTFTYLQNLLQRYS